MIWLANRVNARRAPSERLLRALRSRQKKYDKQVTAFMRTAGRHNRASRPKSGVDVGLLVLDQLKRQNTALEGILDTMRYSVRPHMIHTVLDVVA